MQIQNNLPSMNASRNQSISERKIRKSLEKLSSGFRIVRAGDDAAGLAISEGMRSQINGLNQAMRNVNDGIGLTNVGDGALTEVHAILHRMETLATEAANGPYTQDARDNIDMERKEPHCREYQLCGDSPVFKKSGRSAGQPAAARKGSAKRYSSSDRSIQGRDSGCGVLLYREQGAAAG